jgi:pyridinium-3,5-bisthiocarboxylic acid mononucleotide nickel chelatase
MARHLHIDPFAGIAGDMFLGACVDLGVPLEAIDAALRPLPIHPAYRLTVAQTFRHGIRGLDFKVLVATTQGPAQSIEHRHDLAHGHAHHHSHDHGSGPASPGSYRYIMELIDQLDAPPRARERARAITRQIGQAEAHVHAIALDQVHFHEVGAVDSIVDMLGAAVALELLDVETVSSGSLPIGHGFVRCAHGVMPLPAPATAEILKHVQHHAVNREGETVTPTGAAIVAALAGQFGPMPSMKVDQVGYGAGDRDPADVPNLLRLFLGTRTSQDSYDANGNSNPQVNPIQSDPGRPNP